MDTLTNVWWKIWCHYACHILLSHKEHSHLSLCLQQNSPRNIGISWKHFCSYTALLSTMIRFIRTSTCYKKLCFCPESLHGFNWWILGIHLPFSWWVDWPVRPLSHFTTFFNLRGIILWEEKRAYVAIALWCIVGPSPFLVGQSNVL
jgi:hypothetical protein